MERFRYVYKLKGLIVENCAGTNVDRRYAGGDEGIFRKICIGLYKGFLGVKWDVRECMKKLRVPTMLVVRPSQNNNNEHNIIT